MISGGCVLGNSQVRHSILFSEVSVGNYCELDGVLALAGCQIGANSKLRNVILDNGCIVPEGTTIGYDVKSDAAVYHVTEEGTVVINRRMLGQSIKYSPEL
jgi:glucose-1-phosphate adenylyltransferase